ncbi:ThiF family protein [Besnoitia besnoiti]|uniref:ThiF family protein n=1 Tax=Besnoitia besnoiti TaxID=94643 RepID=A0A2A9MBI5_BESBE|nr:ThiF family protein [Besnoitia besnoiti]PFH35848.1 ThiF family protein [Besnoitia besnoiti]
MAFLLDRALRLQTTATVSSPLSVLLFFSGLFLGTALGALHPLGQSASRRASPGGPLACLLSALRCFWLSLVGRLTPSGPLAAPPAPSRSLASSEADVCEEPERRRPGANAEVGDAEAGERDRALSNGWIREGGSPSSPPSSLPSPAASGASVLADEPAGTAGSGDSWVDVGSLDGRAAAEQNVPRHARVAESGEAAGAVNRREREAAASVSLHPLSPCLALSVERPAPPSALPRPCLPPRSHLFGSGPLRALCCRSRSVLSAVLGRLSRGTPREQGELRSRFGFRLRADWWNETAEYAHRYSRQFLLSNWGLGAQARIRQSAVLVVGCGGLGCPAALYLCAAGIGRLGLVDGDDVEVSNLQRQVAHTEARAESKKVHSLRDSCRAVNSQIAIEAFPFHVSWENALDLVSRFDVVVDATDNQPTRFLLNDACLLAGKPLVCGSALRWEGQLCVYNLSSFRHSAAGASTPSSSVAFAPSVSSPCYRCLHPSPSVDSEAGACDVHGVMGPAPGLIGVLQALEVLKICGGLRRAEDEERLLVFDALDVDRPVRTFRLRRKRDGCEGCGAGPQRIASLTARPEYAAVCPFPVLPAHLRMSPSRFTFLFSLQLLHHRQLASLLTAGFWSGLLLPSADAARQPSARDASAPQLHLQSSADRGEGRRPAAGVPATAGGDAPAGRRDNSENAARTLPSAAAAGGSAAARCCSPLACSSFLSAPQEEAVKAALRTVLLSFSRISTESRPERAAIGSECGLESVDSKRAAAEGMRRNAQQKEENYILVPIDVRPVEHIQVGQLPFALHIPLPQLRRQVEAFRKLEVQELIRGATLAPHDTESDSEDESSEATRSQGGDSQDARSQEIEQVGEDRGAVAVAADRGDGSDNPACTPTSRRCQVTSLQRFVLQQLLGFSLEDFQPPRRALPAHLHFICVLICRRGNDSAIATKLLASLDEECASAEISTDAQSQSEVQGRRMAAHGSTDPSAEVTKNFIPSVSVLNLTGGLLQLQRDGFLPMPIV